MHKIILIIYCLFLFFAVGQSQSIKRLDGSSISFSTIDQTVKELMQEYHIQGLSLAILNKNKTAFIKSYGFRNQPKNQLLDTASIVYGASLSKAVFGYLCMKLVDEKVLDLDKPLFQYLKKDISEYDYFADLKTDDRWKMITARMCLSHTTGLPNVRWFNPNSSEPDTLGIMKIYFNPGFKYAYSGEGFKLLQLVVEEITKQPIDRLATERIFGPMGMNRTGYVWHDSFGDENVAVGHLNNGLIDQKKKRTEAVAGGSLVTTIADYARFVEQVMQEKGLSKKSFQEMLDPQIAIHSKTQFPPITYETTTENDGIQLSYGLGWGVFNCSYGKAFFKEGNGGSWRNYNISFLDKDISIIILVNSENGEFTFQALLQKILADNCIPWKWEGYEVPIKK
jgi:CubicO group peptidase (beta-lactamase class C family)